MSGKSNKKRIHARGGGDSSKRPGTNSAGKGRRKKTKRSDNTTNNTGRSTRTRSVVDTASVVGKIPKALQNFNKPSRKENKEKEGLDKTNRKERQKRSDTTTGTGGTTGEGAPAGNNNTNSGTNKRRVSSTYKDDSEYSSKTSSLEEEDEDEEWIAGATKKNKKTTATKKKKTTVVTKEQRTQLRQLNRPISIMVAWDKPKKNNSPPQWPKSVSNYIVIKKTNMDTSRISLEGIIQLVEDYYLPNSYGLGSYEDMNVFYDDVNSSIVPSESPSNYEETRSKSWKGISSDTQLLDAIINEGVTYDVCPTHIPHDDDDDDDDDDDEGDETYHHIDLLIRLKRDGVTNTSTAPRRGRAPATVKIPDKIEVTVCDLVVQRAPRDGDDEDDEVFVPESIKTFGTVVYSYQEFGTTKAVGNVVYALWQQYDTDTRGNIGQRSPLYLKTNRQGKGKMTQITTSLQLSEETDKLLKKTHQKYVTTDQDGDAVFRVELSLGLRGASSIVMQQSVIADQLQQATFTQESYDPPANEEDRGGGTRRGRRRASRSLNESALSMFKTLYLNDDTNNPYFHALCHEHRSVFLTRYENDSSERRQLLEQLNDGEYPSLDWMLENPLIDASIPPGSKKWRPIDHHGTPPYALPRARPSAWKDDMKGILGGFLEDLEDTTTVLPPPPQPQATWVNFFRNDLVNNERYEIPVPPKYIRRACDRGDNGGTGNDLILQAHHLARNYTRVPLFTANLQQYKDQLNDDTMKIYYQFNRCKFPSSMFLRMSIADILKGNNTNTVQIEMIVEKVGTQLKDDDGVFF